MSALLLSLFLCLGGCAKTSNKALTPIDHGPYSQSPIPAGSGMVFSDDLKLMFQSEADGKKGAMVIAAVNSNGVSYFAVGDTGKEKRGAPDENTFFEIGSVSKVFTALALAIAVDKGEVKLDDRYVDHIPNSKELGVKMNVDITLEHLLQHTSGLPRLPGNMEISPYATDPYANYSEADLITYLKRPNSLRPPGEKYAYSNVGTGILGWVLARKQGLDFSGLMRSHIFEPLQMADTTVVLSEKQRLRKAQGYLSDGTPTRGWTFQSLAPAGAIHSTARDMASFAAVFLELSSSPLGSSVSLMRDHPLRVTKEGRPILIGFGWHVYQKGGKKIVFHNGKTGSSDAFLGFDLEKKQAIVILSTLNNNVTNIGFGFLGLK